MNLKNKQKLKILFAASEFAPIVKVGGLGDVIGSLPKALVRQGCKVGIVIPKYEGIEKKYPLKPAIKNFKIRFGRECRQISVYRLSRNKIDIFFIENKKYLSRGPIYFEHTAFVGSFKEIQRFLFFSKAVHGLLDSDKLPFRPDILHCHDWHTGALLAMLQGQLSGVALGKKYKTIFTIHNLANQGKWNARQIEKWFGKNNFKKFGKNNNFMIEGILNSDIVSTVSPTYAKEILTKKYGAGLENLLRKKGLVGILNGIDYDFYNPQKDRFLFKKYSANRLTFKNCNKIALQKKLDLKIDKNTPVFGLISRLTRQKGIKLIPPIVGNLIKKYGAQFIFLGRGELKYENALKRIAQKFPKNIFVKIGFDEELAHQIYAGADFFLMPSIFEPCGLGQMIAMRYGAIPVCRKTGGLKDSVIDGKTGFLFNRATPFALEKNIIRALKIFDDKKIFRRMRKNCVSQNFSWDSQSAKYVKIYQQLKNLFIKNMESAH